MSGWVDEQLAEKIWVLVGTRPEVIKQVPLYWALVEKLGKKSVALVGTGQHRELLEQSLSHFDVKLDFNYRLENNGLTLTDLGSKILDGFGKLIAAHRPKLIVVQGDTLSAAMVALAAFLNKVPVIHNEAGLRSYDLEQPFPEEGNRKFISSIAALHLAPTNMAAQALQLENIPENQIEMVGNTVVDALHWTLSKPNNSEQVLAWRKKKEQGRKLVLVTSHRRENKEAMDSWYDALAGFLKLHEDVELICPIHPNNLAREAASSHLADVGRVHIVDPLSYHETCHLLRMCHMVVTDSGGIQEECATLSVPVVVCRKKTERMEAVELGLSQLADPCDMDQVRKSLLWAYELGPQDNKLWPYGHGDAGARIANLIAKRFDAIVQA